MNSMEFLGISFVKWALVMSSSEFYLLYRTGLAPTNGTSVQLSRLFAGHEQDIVHLMWDIGEAGSASVPRRIVADDTASPLQWPFTRGKGVFSKFRKSLRVGWWGGHELNVPKLKRHLATFSPHPQWAFVVCMREWDARRAYALKEATRCSRYVLHVMDIFHQELTNAETPLFLKLVRDAEHVFCISPLIAAEMERCGAKATSIVPCVTDFTAQGRAPLACPLRIVLTGSIWVDQYLHNPALDILAAAWPIIAKRHSGVQLHYAGAVGRMLPEALRRVVIDHGLLPPTQCEELLKQCHLAYLPVSHPSNTVGRYSVPSRIADYLACGLPTITSTDENTGIASFMRQAPPKCTANIRSTDELLAAIERLTSDGATWAQASADAATFAAERLHARKVSVNLFEELSGIEALQFGGNNE